MISQEALQKILGIKEKVSITSEDMADDMNITFFPQSGVTSKNVEVYVNKLKSTFDELNVNIVPFDEALEKVSFFYFLKKIFFIFINNILFVLNVLFKKENTKNFIDFFTLKSLLKRKKRLKSGISVVYLPCSNEEALPIDFVSSFKKSSIITVVDLPDSISSHSNFHEHFDVAMDFFANYMTNIVIAVTDKDWIIYNFNASHPRYSISKNFKENVLKALIPKIVAPIIPIKFSEFILEKNSFDVNGEFYRKYIEDLRDSADLIKKSNLYPDGKRIDDLPFRNNFYRWIGKIHLDNRNGMSYGFLAWQLPSKLPDVRDFEEFSEEYKKRISGDGSYFETSNGKIFIIIEINTKRLCVEIPDVWILSQRSGSDKMNIKPDKDLVKLGLVGGKLYLQTPKGLKLDDDYKPSFDTAVMLAHGLGNLILGAIFKYFKINSDFVYLISNQGLSLSHWHGYLNPKYIPKGWYVYGEKNLHVSCSTPQSAIYALQGKFEILSKILKNRTEYLGDIHIEPHHGTNMTHVSLKGFGGLLLGNKDISELGNKYLYRYYK